jgi:hypothetical protein
MGRWDQGLRMELSFPAGSSLQVIEHDAIIIDLKVLLTHA